MNNQLIAQQLSNQFPQLKNIEFSRVEEPSDRKKFFKAVDSEDVPVTILISNEDCDDVLEVFFSDIEDEDNFKKVGVLQG